MARQSRQRFNRGGARPNRGWSVSMASTFSTLAVSSKVLVVGFVPATAIDLTVLRTVGVLAIASDQSAATEEQIGAFGMIMVSDTAFAAGAASIPSPVADAENDGWFVFQAFNQASERSLGSRSSVEYHFDSKAKRIVPSTGVTIAVMIANASASHAAEFSLSLRVLTQVRGTT